MKQKGFTLIETLVAVLILSMSIGALLTLAASGFYSVRYARNQIVADNLAQEALEFIRNSRDSAIQQGASWTDWVSNTLTANDCFDADGCAVDPYTASGTANSLRGEIIPCGNTCPAVNFFPGDDAAYILYAYEGDYSGISMDYYETTYIRTIRAEAPTPDEVVVTVEMEWKNGTLTRTTQQSLLLTDWQAPL